MADSINMTTSFQSGFLIFITLGFGLKKEEAVPEPGKQPPKELTIFNFIDQGIDLPVDNRIGRSDKLPG